jgi:hypothetical protein
MIRNFTLYLAALALCAAAADAAPNLADHIERPLRYRPEGTDFVIENGAEFFNRPLYGNNTAFRVDAGDKPEFSLYLPGRGGNLRLGIRTSAGGMKWLNDAEHIIARYRAGSMLYEINDSLLGKGTLNLTVLALFDAEGLVLCAALNGASAPVELVWAYGGVNGQRGNRDGDIGTEREPVSRYFQLRPENCRSNEFTIAGSTFTLRSKPASIVGLAPRGARLAVADANRWTSIQDLLASAGKPTDLPVVVGQVGLSPDKPVYLGLQRAAQRSDDRGELGTYLEVRGERPGQQSEAAPVAQPVTFKPENLPQIFDSAARYRRALAEKVVAETPDPFINAATAALCVAADAVWDEPGGTVMHGAVAWRSKLLGWRGPYANDALGWHDRARRHFVYWSTRQNTNAVPAGILPADPTMNLSRNEPSLHSNGDMSNSHYDMNAVYIDALFRHILWTGDLDFARRMWPVIERHLAWERRLFRRPFGADGLPLYEAYAAIWASDDLEYEGGGATHATAYNYYHNKMAARLAKLLGADAAPYEREADLIQRAMRRELWLADRGWYVEWKDLLGLQLVHPNAALWTFYHTVDSEAATPMEAWQMTRFVDTQIAHIPIRGPGVPEGYYTLPTTSWMPYTWSLNNVVMAEVQHTALAYWETGRSAEAFRMFEGSILDSMYLGLCPGNAGMCTWFDMARGETQRDFADAVGVASRALVEGLFGVAPDALAGELCVRPGFPAEWDHAGLRHPDFTFSFRRDGLKETFSIEPKFFKPMALRLEVAALRDGIVSVTVNGQPAKWRLVEDAVETPRIEITNGAVPRHEVVITWQGASPTTARAEEVLARGGEVHDQFGAAQLLDVSDPQTALSGISKSENSFRATATGALGHRSVFARVQQGQLRWWVPVPLEIRPAYEIVAAETQDAEHLRFRVRNNTAANIDRDEPVRAGGQALAIRPPPFVRLHMPAFGESDEIVLPREGCWPGSNRVFVEVGDQERAEGVVINWKFAAPAENAKFESVDLAPSFNDRVTQIFRNEYLSPRSPNCSLAIPKQGIGSWCSPQARFEVDDTGWRAVAEKNSGRFVLPQGVPFNTPGEGDAKNIVFTSQWDNYPHEATVPLGGRASHIYLLMAGSSNPMQSRFDNGEVIVTYADGSAERLGLQNPTTWWPIDQDYLIDDFAFRRPEPVPPRVDLRTGTVRLLDATTFKGKGGRIPGGAATVLDLPLQPEKELKLLTVRTLANEVVIGLMAVTLAR